MIFAIVLIASGAQRWARLTTSAAFTLYAGRPLGLPDCPAFHGFKPRVFAGVARRSRACAVFNTVKTVEALFFVSAQAHFYGLMQNQWLSEKRFRRGAAGACDSRLGPSSLEGLVDLAIVDHSHKRGVHPSILASDLSEFAEAHLLVQIWKESAFFVSAATGYDVDIITHTLNPLSRAAALWSSSRSRPRASASPSKRPGHGHLM